MKYFDDRLGSRSKTISEFELKSSCVRSYAGEFYSDLSYKKGYPRPILNALANALARNNICEILIMADATTKYAKRMADAFDDEMSRAVTKESRFELICVAMSALFAYQFGYVRYGNRLYQRAFEEKERYDAEYGSRDFAFLAHFIEERCAAIREEAIEGEEKQQILVHMAEEQQRKEQLENERQRDLQKQARIEETRKNHELRMTQHKERNAARKVEIAQFRQKSAAEQLKVIVSGRKVPQAYGIDCAAITDATLREIPRNLLLQVVMSFQNVKDAGWKDLRERAAAVLSE